MSVSWATDYEAEPDIPAYWPEYDAVNSYSAHEVFAEEYTPLSVYFGTEVTPDMSEFAPQIPDVVVPVSSSTYQKTTEYEIQLSLATTLVALERLYAALIAHPEAIMADALESIERELRRIKRLCKAAVTPKNDQQLTLI